VEALPRATGSSPSYHRRAATQRTKLPSWSRAAHRRGEHCRGEHRRGEQRERDRPPSRPSPVTPGRSHEGRPQHGPSRSVTRVRHHPMTTNRLPCWNSPKALPVGPLSSAGPLHLKMLGTRLPSPSSGTCRCWGGEPNTRCYSKARARGRFPAERELATATRTCASNQASRPRSGHSSMAWIIVEQRDHTQP
jgi:hypothetical protein